MVMVGYCRASSVSQSMDLQREQLLAAGAQEIFEEKRSGTSTKGRDQLEAALRFVRKGDVLVVSRLDRLARSMTDLCKIMDTLTEKQVGFRALQQGGVDTTRPESRLLLNLLGAFAEFETAIRAERQAEGIAKAKAQGRYKGRPASIDPSRIAELRAQGLRPTAIARALGIGRASYYGSRPMFPLLRSRKSGPVFRTLLLPCGRIGRYPLRYVSLGVSLV